MEIDGLIYKKKILKPFTVHVDECVSGQGLKNMVSGKVVLLVCLVVWLLNLNTDVNELFVYKRTISKIQYLLKNYNHCGYLGFLCPDCGKCFVLY